MGGGGGGGGEMEMNQDDHNNNNNREEEETPKTSSKEEKMEINEDNNNSNNNNSNSNNDNGSNNNNNNSSNNNEETPQTLSKKERMEMNEDKDDDNNNNNNNEETPKTSSKKYPRSGLRSVDTYAAQCDKCKKWRIIPTEEEYEDMRSRILEEPFVCEKKPGVSCEDNPDIDYDNSRTWVIDKPGIPKTPKGFKRSLLLRRDYSKMDAYYITPTGKKLKTQKEIAAFLEADPQYKDVSLSDFNFNTPKVMEDTIPEDALRKLPPSGNSNRKMKTNKDAS